MQAVAPLSASPLAARSDGRRCRPGQGTERRRPHNGQQDRDTGLAEQTKDGLRLIAGELKGGHW